MTESCSKEAALFGAPCGLEPTIVGLRGTRSSWDRTVKDGRQSLQAIAMASSSTTPWDFISRTLTSPDQAQPPTMAVASWCSTICEEMCAFQTFSLKAFES